MFEIIIKSKKQKKRFLEAMKKEIQYWDKKCPDGLFIPQRVQFIDYNKRIYQIEIDQDNIITGNDKWIHAIQIRYKPFNQPQIYKKMCFFRRKFDSEI